VNAKATFTIHTDQTGTQVIVETPLHAAAKMSFTETVEFLREHGGVE
jgi:hypothetical protein